MNYRGKADALKRVPTHKYSKGSISSREQSVPLRNGATSLRIAVLRALNLGDMLLAVPALRALRRAYPEAEITLIGLPWAADFSRRFRQYIDRFVEFGGYPDIVEVPFEPERSRRFIEEQRAYHYDLVIQMHGNGHTSNGLALALSGRATIGYYAENDRPDARLTSGLPYPENQPEVIRNLGLARLATQVIPPSGGRADAREELKRQAAALFSPELEFPLFTEDLAEAAAHLRRLARADRPWIGLHPGAHAPARRWPVAHFAALGDALARAYSAQLLITGGPGEEEAARELEQRLRTPALNLAGKTSLGGLAALISKLDLFISNDTGPAHLADALDTPSITIFGPADPVRWAPLDRERHPVVRHPVACSPCSFRECPIDHRCLERISPETVLQVAHNLLRETYTTEPGRREAVLHTRQDNSPAPRTRS